MAILAMSLTNGTLTIIRSTDANVETVSVRNDDARWDSLMNAYKEGDDSKIERLLSLSAVMEQYSEGNLTVNATGVYYRGKLLHTLDAQRIMAFVKDKVPFERYAKFVGRKLKNISARAIEEMYKFLENEYMPLTPQGTFIAYKGVQNDYYSVHGNTNTVIIQGIVNEKGQIRNMVGDVIEIERSSCDDNYRNGCSFGLHAGSLAYASGFAQRIVLVEIDPADVVSVPDEGTCHKLRCCKYKVVGEYTGPLPKYHTDEFSTETPPTEECDGEDDCGCGCPDCYPEMHDDGPDCECCHNDCEVCNDQTYAVKHTVENNDVCDGYDDCGCSKCCGETTDESGENWSEATRDSDTHNTTSDGEGPFWVNNNIPQSVTEINELGDMFGSYHYLSGYNDGFSATTPVYLYGDDKGADSEDHRRYILGYLQGYRDQKSSQ